MTVSLHVCPQEPIQSNPKLIHAVPAYTSIPYCWPVCTFTSPHLSLQFMLTQLEYPQVDVMTHQACNKTT